MSNRPPKFGISDVGTNLMRRDRYTHFMLVRRWMAVLACVFLVCAVLISAGAPLLNTDLSAPTLKVVNTDDGVTLDESVLDDLRPGLAQDLPFNSLITDQLPSLMVPTSAAREPWARHAAPDLRPPPCLAGLLRPPALS
jgi:hypothetical protein